MKKGLFLITGAALVVIGLVPRIDGYMASFRAGASDTGSSVMFRLLGEGRSIVSYMSVLQADRYFHGGIGHAGDDHGGIFAGKDGYSEGGEEDHREAEAVLPGAGPYNVLFRLSEETELTQHVHLKSDQLKEIVPWLYYAIKADPHNVLAYTLAGYYLADRFGKTEQALKLLREGLTNNPGSWEICADMGRIYLKHLQDPESAERYLLRAREYLDDAPHDKFQERYVLTLLAMAYEKRGKTGEEVELYERLNELFPGRKPLEDKIKKLKE